MVRWRVNLLCLVGAVIGPTAIFSTWVEARFLVWGMSYNLVDILNSVDSGLLMAGAWLFLVGTLICFLSPLGGIPQLVGVALFFFWFLPEAEGDMPSGIGPYIAVVSGIVALISVAKPIGLNYEQDHVGLKSRLLTFNRNRPTGGGTSMVQGGKAMRCPKCGAEVSEDKKFCGDCGAEIQRQASVQQDQVVCQAQPYKLRVNVLCLIGAILAVLSLFLPWTLTQDRETGDTDTLGAFDYGETFPDNFRYAVTLFLIGMAAAFFTPLGGLLQLIGSIGFVMTALTSTFPEFQITFWAGSAMAMFSAALVVIGLISPLGIGYGADKEIGIATLLTFSITR